MATARLVKRYNGSTWDVVSPAVQVDSVVRRTLTDLGLFATWLTGNGVKGVLGEVGWANSTKFAGDGPKWDAVGGAWLKEVENLHAEGADLDWQYWTAGSDQISNDGGVTPVGVLPAYYGGASLGGIVRYAGPQAAIFEPYLAAGTYRRGVNWSASYTNAVDNTSGAAATLISGGRFNSANPGVRGTDYWYPTAADLVYLASRGVRGITLRVRWERLQPALGTALDAGELAAIQATVAAANMAGIKVAVTNHTGWGYLLGSSPTVWDTHPVSQSGPVTVAHFVDFWTRLSAALKGTPGLMAYDLMNEPWFPSCGLTSGPELLTNPSFDTDTTAWTMASGGSMTQTTAQAHTGAGSLQVTTSGTLAIITSGAVSVTPGAAYQAQVFVRAQTAGTRFPGVSIAYYDAQGALVREDKSAGVIPSTFQWRNTSIASTAPARAVTAKVNVLVRANGTGEVQYVDDVSLKACTNPLTGAALWQSMSQQAVTAIRGNSDTTECWVQIADGATPASLALSPTAWITDPANATRYNVHHYFDHATSGGGVHSSTYAAELTYETAQGY